MYLLNVDEATQSLSTQSPTQAGAVLTGGVRDISRYATPLVGVTAKVEEALEVATFREVVTTDTFIINGRQEGNYTLRLTNGFLSSAVADFAFVNSQGETQALDAEDIDYERGLIFARLSSGRFRVTYKSGFPVDDQGVFIGVPSWLKSIAMMALVMHYRLTANADKTPTNVSYADIMDAIRRDVYSRSTKRWQRPRVGVNFPDRSITHG